MMNRTVGAGNLAPDHPDLGSANLLLGLVDICDLLAEVEAMLSQLPGSFLHLGVRNTYLAALWSSTPSILIRLVLEWVVCRER
jgi:hypothetical protein